MKAFNGIFFRLNEGNSFSGKNMIVYIKSEAGKIAVRIIRPKVLRQEGLFKK